MAVKVPVAIAVQHDGQSCCGIDECLENELACSSGAFGYVNWSSRVHALNSSEEC